MGKDKLVLFGYMKAVIILMTFGIISILSCNKHSAQRTTPAPPTIVDKGYNSPANYDGYRLVWSDEFSGKEIDQNSWVFETGRGGNGWGNNELQYYTRENAETSQGYLVITARKEQLNGAAYTSSRMITKGKKDFRFGRIDIRARIPQGQGIWPALWMLGANVDTIGWPLSGEIDIMEVVGHEANKVYGTMHWGSDSGHHRSKGLWNILSSGKYSDEFHVYSLLWKENEIRVMVDDREYFKLTKNDVDPDPYPFNKPHYLLFNVAVGGNWPGSPDATTVFPQQMIVDYVRVFEPQ